MLVGMQCKTKLHLFWPLPKISEIQRRMFWPNHPSEDDVANNFGKFYSIQGEQAALEDLDDPPAEQWNKNRRELSLSKIIA